MARDYSKLDTWSLRAQKAGYPARSVYKLSELDKKFHIITSLKNNLAKASVLDLGSAPGSWTQWLLENCQNTAVVSCDLKDLAIDEAFGRERGNSLHFFKGDLTTRELQVQIKKYAPYKAVLCDAAPKTTGNRLIDTEASLQIVKMARFYADYIVRGGSFVAKIFQGGGNNELFEDLKKLFSTVKTFKPVACRKESFETYLIALGKITGEQ